MFNICPITFLFLFRGVSPDAPMDAPTITAKPLYVKKLILQSKCFSRVLNLFHSGANTFAQVSM